VIEEILVGYAAIDVGSVEHCVAAAGADVKGFGSCTAEIRKLIDHLKDHKIRYVAMEATGVYWIALHDMLREAGLEVTVFNGAHARNLPGRKSDFSDCQWHAMLHSHGLLRPCFIPPSDIVQLRCLYRLRDDHVSMAAAHIQHMQKALDLMNVRLHTVISQINGVSGLRIIRAILNGERSPEKLVALCDVRIQRKSKEVLESLEGRWEPHHLFALRQALDCYEFYQTKIAECDARIDQLLVRMNEARPKQLLPPGPRKRARHNAPQIQDLDGKLLRLADGRDVASLPGISPLGFLKLIGETGLDMSPWKTEKHFTSWLGLAPGRHQSGKISRRVRPKKTVAGQIFREAAMSVACSKNLSLGAYYRRLKGKRGPAIAIKALARKLAVLYYNMMTKGLAYVETGIERYKKKMDDQRLRYVEKLAKQLGLTLVQTNNLQQSPLPAVL
jgi:transposase